MSLIDYTYFKGLLAVPSASNLATVMADQITVFENEFLDLLLGYNLRVEFLAAYAASIQQSNPVALAQKWVDLKDGAEFTFEVNGRSYARKWEGLVNSRKASPIANYVFYQYITNDNLNKFGATSFAPKGQAPSTVAPAEVLRCSWNNMIDMYGETPRIYFDCEFSDNVDTYQHFDNKSSAYNFLLANKENYSNWVFSPLFKMSLW